MSATASLTLAVAVSLTMSAQVRVITYTDARCPSCARVVMALPGTPVLETRAVRSNAERAGRGPVVKCHRCGTLCEVVSHR